MSRIALLEPPYADQAGALLARMMPGDVPPIGLFRMFARTLPMAGALHGWGRFELGRQLTLTGAMAITTLTSPALARRRSSESNL